MSDIPWERRIDPADPDYCARCNYCRHDCPGCGANLRHGLEVCGDCARIESQR